MIDLHYWPTPNGYKITIFLEETGLPYEPHLVSFQTNDQMSPEFLSLNPNNNLVLNRIGGGASMTVQQFRASYDGAVPVPVGMVRDENFALRLVTHLIDTSAKSEAGIPSRDWNNFAAAPPEPSREPGGSAAAPRPGLSTRRDHAVSRSAASGVSLRREPDVARPAGFAGVQDRPPSCWWCRAAAGTGVAGIG